MDVQEGVGTGLLGAIIGATLSLVSKLVGSPKERAEAKREEADATAVIVDAAKDVIEAQREDTKSVRAERDDCTARLVAHEKRSAKERAEDRERIAKLEAGLAEHSRCGPRITSLERQVERLTMQSTPPIGYTGDDVRAEMARLEETGP